MAFSTVEFGSRKLPRTTRSSLGCETQAANDAEGELAYMRLAYLETEKGSVNLQNISKELHKVTGVMVSDCKALYDSLMTSESSCLGQEDKRNGIETLALKENIVDGGTLFRWVHTHAMLADALTKNSSAAEHGLRLFLSTPYWKLVFDENFVSGRKRIILKKDILDEVHDGDREKVKAILKERQIQKQIEKNAGAPTLASPQKLTENKKIDVLPVNKKSDGLPVNKMIDASSCARTLTSTRSSSAAS